MSGFTKVAVILMLLLFIIFFFKDGATYSAHNKIMEAITDYNIACIKEGNLSGMLEFTEMEPYNKTMWRLNDWGYTNILSEESFELVAPYIK